MMLYARGVQHVAAHGPYIVWKYFLYCHSGLINQPGGSSGGGDGGGGGGGQSRGVRLEINAMWYIVSARGLAAVCDRILL